MGPQEAVADTSASIIDHIITNDLSHKLIPGNIRIDDLSDHFLTYVIIRDKNKPKVKRCKRIKLRDTNNFSPTIFKNDLVMSVSGFLNSLPVVDENNFNIVFNDFHDRFTKVLDKNAPFKLLSRKRSKLAHKPWISKGILASIQNKPKMYKTHFIGGSEIAKTSYKAYANKLTKVKCLAKKLYFHSELENCKGDGRKIWDLLYSLLPSKKNKQCPKTLEVGGDITHDPKLIAQKFCDHFSTIASKIVKDNPNPTSADSFKRFLNRRISDSIFLQPTEPGEILNTINSLNVRKSSGFDHIPPYFVELAGPVISEPFSVLVNHSITLGIFPEVLKVAKVIPVYKSGSRHNPTNYRPISLLSCFAKIFEKLLYKRLDIFIRTHSIIAPTQYGFRSGLSTMHAVTDVLTLVYDNIHEKKFSGLIFLDIQKAFDTVDHNILIAKLEHYGIRGIAKNLFESYLQNRQQFVALDDETRLYTTNWGVPQGSTLGPLLFLIYINDLINCTSVTPRLFADDTCLCFSLPNPENLQEIINSDLKIVSDWITANKLRINAQKSSALIISPKSNDKAY